MRSEDQTPEIDETAAHDAAGNAEQQPRRRRRRPVNPAYQEGNALDEMISKEGRAAQESRAAQSEPERRRRPDGAKRHRPLTEEEERIRRARRQAAMEAERAERERIAAETAERERLAAEEEAARAAAEAAERERIAAEEEAARAADEGADAGQPRRRRRVRVDENGNPVPRKPRLDENGNPIVRKPRLDENGNPVPRKRRPRPDAAAAEAAAADEAAEALFAEQQNTGMADDAAHSGQPKRRRRRRRVRLDENGNPIYPVREHPAEEGTEGADGAQSDEPRRRRRRRRRPTDDEDELRQLEAIQEGDAPERGFPEEEGYTAEGYSEGGYSEDGYSEDGSGEEDYAEEGGLRKIHIVLIICAVVLGVAAIVAYLMNTKMAQTAETPDSLVATPVATMTTQTTMLQTEAPTVQTTMPSKSVLEMRHSIYKTSMIVVGDAIAAGYARYGYIPEENDFARGSVSIRNLHDFTFTYDEEEMDINDILKELQPSYLLLSMGTNDINLTTPDLFISSYEKEIRSILTISPNTNILVASITPIDEDSNFSDNLTIREFNDALVQMVMGLGSPQVVYFDAYSVVADPESGALREVFSNDGVHLSGDAYPPLLDGIYQVIDQAFPFNDSRNVTIQSAGDTLNYADENSYGGSGRTYGESSGEDESSYSYDESSSSYGESSYSYDESSSSYGESSSSYDESSSGYSENSSGNGLNIYYSNDSSTDDDDWDD